MGSALRTISGSKTSITSRGKREKSAGALKVFSLKVCASYFVSLFSPRPSSAAQRPEADFKNNNEIQVKQ